MNYNLIWVIGESRRDSFTVVGLTDPGLTQAAASRLPEQIAAIVVDARGHT